MLRKKQGEASESSSHNLSLPLSLLFGEGLGEQKTELLERERMGKIDSLCSFRVTLLTRTKWPDARIREELSLGRISFAYNGREVLFAEVEKGKASPGKLFFRGAPWDREDYREFLGYMLAAMKKIFGRAYGEEKIRESVRTGKLETRLGEAEVVLLGNPLRG